MAAVELVKRERNTKRFTAGQTIFAEGDSDDRFFYVVETGQVEIANHKRFLEVVGPGGFFGEMGLISKKPRSATATAKSDCVLIQVNEGDFYFLIQHAPFFALEMMQVLAERVRRNADV
ncbi:MAG: cyclic nucleotide-binding domain-containing protein [Anaerolineae bacterium]|nr:cyclic nucleotide-binding domain-containing protein [Anaerolineae bacterium]